MRSKASLMITMNLLFSLTMTVPSAFSKSIQMSDEQQVVELPEASAMSDAYIVKPPDIAEGGTADLAMGKENLSDEFEPILDLDGPPNAGPVDTATEASEHASNNNFAKR